MKPFHGTDLPAFTPVRRIAAVMAVITLAAAMLAFAGAGKANAQTRTLKIHYTHTNERAEVTYMRNGRLVQSGVDQMNHLLRDWRRNEPTRMDPRLFDMLWELYRVTGATDYIHIVSAYRSPATNAMLRSRSSGVAQNSQHTLGKAIDFFIPGVPVSRLRAAALRMEGGGVGYYPRSGSPFVHIDVGSVRHWPRMNRNDLMAVFPDGRTIHTPSDGRPLPGYQQAKAAYDARQRNGGGVQIAGSDSGSSSGGGGGGLLATLFGNRNSGQQAAQQPTQQASAAPARQAATPQPQQPVGQQQQQQRQPAQTPETILAALPSRSVPIPLAAPRPSASVGAEAQVAAVEPQQPPAAAPEVPAAAETVMASVPLPSWRPDFTPPAAEPPVAVAAAPEAEADSDIAVAAIAGELPRSMGSDAISGLLALRSEGGSVPVPMLRPAAASAGDATNGGLPDMPARGQTVVGGDEDMIVLAALPDTSARSPEQLSSEARAVLAEGAELQERKLAAITASASASPRVAVMGREAGQDAVSALESGVRTTPRSARAVSAEARQQRRPRVMPVEGAVGSWALAPQLETITVASSNGAASTSSAQDLVRSTPRQIYTEGFQRGRQADEPNRFTGSAVRFLSVARFQ